MAGSIITFYSFKGGVGRSLAVANVAIVLARWGYRVLCVDWDLEAPGLHHYFERWLGRGWTSGLMDLIEGVSKSESLDWLGSVNTIAVPNEPWSLHLLCAGTFDQHYHDRMQSLNWDELYSRHALGARLEQMRTEWKSHYDFILVDSRTGVTDIGGICTIQLPDRLVLLATASRQSVDGIVDVARRACARHSKLPYDRAGIACVPLVARFDGRVERGLSLQWLDEMSEAFAPFYSQWLHRTVTSRQLLDLLRIPYVPRYSYGEDLPILAEESTRDPEGMGYSYETIAALLSRDLSETNLLVNSRDAYVTAARTRAPRTSTFNYEVLISSSEHDAHLAHALAEECRTRGLRVCVASTVHGMPTFEHACSTSRHFLFVLGSDRSWSASLSSELEQAFRELTKNPESDRRIIPILAGELRVEELPPALRSFKHYKLGHSVSDLLAEIDLGPVTSEAAATDTPSGATVSYGPEMQRVLARVRSAANSSAAVMILGEFGVGKEWVVRLILDEPRWKGRPLVVLNCAALPLSEFEATLFGFEKGAFTGAIRAQQGLVEQANGGTLFLDEIGEAPLTVQARFLQVLRAREVVALGAVEPRPVDVRVISATHRDLALAVRQGEFSEALYDHLAEIVIQIPPLRHRTEEIPSLAHRFLQQAAVSWKTRATTLSAAALHALERQSWPGNIRQLRNTIEIAAVRCHGEVIEPEDLRLSDTDLHGHGHEPRALEDGAGGATQEPLGSVKGAGRGLSRRPAGRSRTESD
jgi:cellulose biosynthesis protein BcsQ